MQTITRHTALGLVAAGLMATPAMAEEISLAHFVAPSHTVTGAVVEPLAAALTEASGGEITLRVYPGGELGPGPAEQYVRAVTGVADITWGLMGNNSEQFPLTMLAELPGIVDAGGSGWEAFWRAYDPYLAPEFIGTEPIALWTSEPSVLIMRERQVRTPADLAGLRIRVSGSVPAQVIQSLGATPVQMPANEMYNALQTGLIDGILTGSSAILDFRLNEVARSYTTGISLGNVSFFLVMNEARYQGLSDAHRAALHTIAGPRLSESGEAGWNAKATTALETLRADPNMTVIDLTAEEAAPFNAITVALTEQVIAGLDARGLPASAVAALMRGE